MGDGVRVVVFFFVFSMRKAVRPADANKIANSAQHPNGLGTAGIIDWGRAYEIAIQAVQVLQNRILKYMTFTNRTSSANNIFKLLIFSKFLVCPNLI